MYHAREWMKMSEVLCAWRDRMGIPAITNFLKSKPCSGLENFRLIFVLHRIIFGKPFELFAVDHSNHAPFLLLEPFQSSLLAHSFASTSWEINTILAPGRNSRVSYEKWAFRSHSPLRTLALVVLSSLAKTWFAAHKLPSELDDNHRATDHSK